MSEPSKLKAFAVDIKNAPEMVDIARGDMYNLEGKGENTG